MTNSRIEALRVTTYGNSYPNWPDDWSYLNRLFRRHGWRVTGRAVGGERSVDTASRVIAGSPSGAYVHGSADLVLLDAATNDFMSSGAAGLTGYRNAITAALSWLSLEGPIHDSRTDLIAYAGGWSTSTGPEWGGGSQRTMTSVGSAAHLPTFGRGGKWAVGYYGLAGGTGTGDSFKVDTCGRTVATFSTHNQCVQPGPNAAKAAGGGPRNWTPAAAVVDLPAGATEMLLARDGGGSGGGPFFDWYGKINETNPPIIVCPTPLPLTAAGYALNGSPGLVTDAVVAEYRQALRDAAALVGPHVLVVDVCDGWDPGLMLLPDRMHPNQRGSAHIADRIDAALDCIDW